MMRALALTAMLAMTVTAAMPIAARAQATFSYEVCDKNGKCHDVPYKFFNGTLVNFDRRPGGPVLIISSPEGEQAIGLPPPGETNAFTTRVSSSPVGGDLCEDSKLLAFVGDKVDGTKIQRNEGGPWETGDVHIAVTPEQENVLNDESRRAYWARNPGVPQAQQQEQWVSAEWQKKLAAWRALPRKPPLAAAAEKARMLAEDAIQEKHFADAARFFEQGIMADPFWAEGQFNAALLWAELGFHRAAAARMRAYLDLSPGAKDADQVRRKIVVWEEKAKDECPGYRGN